MKKIILTIQENWKDPVWSKVIAFVIITIITFFVSSLIALFKAVFDKVPFLKTLENIWEFLNKSISLSLLFFIILLLTYLILVLKPFLKFIKQIIFKIKNPKSKVDKTEIAELPNAFDHSTTFFSYRMSSAFPGTRDITWFNNPTKAVERLELLLKEPLRFKGSAEFESDPVWWWRGGSAMYIDKFRKIGRKRVLMDIKQLKIKRIAAYHGESYYKDFVYVEVEGEKSTGLYNYTKEDIDRHIKNIGYSWEEYGVIKNWLGWSIPIRREEYDDGATVIRGKVRNAMKAKLRGRYLSDYNFIIAAKGSPYNSRKFSRESKPYFDGILKKEIEPNEFFEFLKGFAKNER
ncbi:hypothetical protein [Maribacter stanieri]|uniref:Uncharacterized protein n=1 Tax=Maribacter stanieri TaxID=440514 RepID=A0A1I6HBT4_9FLAO|nr:hypothetical protein [Maribacter stanieri]SFR51820.1 hypothetical protein SAMN04488010_0163 [Maribacter stanieri]